MFGKLSTFLFLSFVFSACSAQQELTIKNESIIPLKGEKINSYIYDKEGNKFSDEKLETLKKAFGNYDISLDKTAKKLEDFLTECSKKYTYCMSIKVKEASIEKYVSSQNYYAYPGMLVTSSINLEVNSISINLNLYKSQNYSLVDVLNYKDDVIGNITYDVDENGLPKKTESGKIQKPYPESIEYLMFQSLSKLNDEIKK